MLFSILLIPTSVNSISVGTTLNYDVPPSHMMGSVAQKFHSAEKNVYGVHACACMCVAILLSRSDCFGHLRRGKLRREVWKDNNCDIQCKAS